MGVVLAVKEEPVEGTNTGNDCAPNRSQKRLSRYFTTFYSVLFYLCTLTFVMLNCETALLPGWNPSDSKGKFSFYAFIMNNKVLLYLYSQVRVKSRLSQL